jgi:hypothetical protein
MEDAVECNPYALWWTNFQYSSPFRFKTVAEAREYGVSKCFEFYIVDMRNGNVVGSWSPV